MLRKLLRKNILYSIILFGYQSALDLKKMSLMVNYSSFQNIHLPFLEDFMLANRPGAFVTLYIVHRAFIHGLIVRLFTGKKKMLGYYMLLDLVIFIISFFVVTGKRLFEPHLDFTEPLAVFLLKLLDSPLLLLFFLPSYYIFSQIEEKKE